MTFHLPLGAREFFRIRNSRPFANTETAPNRFLMFDAFSSCMLLGFDRRQQGDENQLEARNFIDGYPDSHRAQAVIYAGLLVDAELARKDIAPEDRGSVEREMISLLDLTSTTRLSTKGNHLLNLYAASGFDCIRGTTSPPANLEDFLVDFAELLRTHPTNAVSA